MPKSWLHDWEGMATMEKPGLETRWVEKLLRSLSLRVLAISNRCSKDSSSALKGLMTNWPHHTIYVLQCADGAAIDPFSQTLPCWCSQECHTYTFSHASAYAPLLPIFALVLAKRKADVLEGMEHRLDL
jgi:hypothetical protein